MKWENWKSPINLISQGLEMKYEGEILQAVARVGIEVDKDELIKCIQYDRNQYENGYQQGRTDREAEIVTIIEQMKESASAMMWTEREVACEKILEQIKEQKNE